MIGWTWLVVDAVDAVPWVLAVAALAVAYPMLRALARKESP